MQIDSWLDQIYFLIYNKYFLDGRKLDKWVYNSCIQIDREIDQIDGQIIVQIDEQMMNRIQD